MMRFKKVFRVKGYGAVILAAALVFGCASEESIEEKGPTSVGGKADEDKLPEDWEIELWENAYRNLQEGRSPCCNSVVPPDGGPFGKKIALTFDDGPDAFKTPKVLDILKQHGIKATFFIQGSHVNTTTKAVMRRAAAEGHILANHTTNHPNCYKLNAARFTSELQSTHNRLKEVLTPMGVEPRYFRFPYGEANGNVASVANNTFNYAIVGWHIDSADWCFAAGNGYCKPSVFGGIANQFRNDFIGHAIYWANKRKGGILLMHDIHNFTANTLDALIKALKRNGYSFTRVDDKSTFPLLNKRFKETQENTDFGDINFVNSIKAGGHYTPGITLYAKGDAKITRVGYYEGTSPLGESSDASSNFSIRYIFEGLGDKYLTAKGYNSEGKVIAQKTVSILVVRGKWVGDSCQSDIECAFRKAKDVGFCFQYPNGPGGELMGFCSLECEGYCPDAEGKASTFCVADPYHANEGLCVSKAEELNGFCGDIPGARPRDNEQRFIGSSSAPSSSATVCLPLQ